MKNRKPLVVPKVDDDPTIKDVITPDMVLAAKAQRATQAERPWSVLSQIAVGVILPTSVALGWWIGAEARTVVAPALTAPAPLMEPQASDSEPRAMAARTEPTKVQGETIPVVAVSDLPLEVAQDEAPARSARFRTRRKGAKPQAMATSR